MDKQIDNSFHLVPNPKEKALITHPGYQDVAAEKNDLDLTENFSLFLGTNFYKQMVKESNFFLQNFLVDLEEYNNGRPISYKINAKAIEDISNQLKNIDETKYLKKDKVEDFYQNFIENIIREIANENINSITSDDLSIGIPKDIINKEYKNIAAKIDPDSINHVIMPKIQPSEINNMIGQELNAITSNRSLFYPEEIKAITNKIISILAVLSFHKVNE